MSAYCGMPALLQLCHFGEIVYEAFGHYPFLVGSCLQAKGWRDIDIRLMLPDEEYDKFMRVDHWGAIYDFNGTWEATNLAYTALAREMTNGLPIDFQVQIMSDAKAKYGDKNRSVLFVRRRKDLIPKEEKT